MMRLSLFTRARIKLTAYYMLIFLTVSGVISGLFFYRTSAVLEAEYDRLERRFQLQINNMMPLQGSRIVFRKIEPEDLAIAKQQIIFQLISINGIILVLVAVSGYILSGITLAPIEASMRQQKRFISDIAHEIKTPLTALKTSLEVNLMDPKITRPIRTLLKENLNDVVHLDDLTTSMLKLSKNQDAPLESTPVLVNHIVNQAVRLVRAQAKTKKISLVIKPIPKDVSINGDKVALIDVIKILLDNAIKYSPSSTSVITSTKISREAIKISIADQGSGIAKTDLDHIFDRFYRADSSRTNVGKPSGYGLGLSIAKTIVEFHHGTISVTSSTGKGSVFTVIFPRSSQ